ncbi:hypothetical protein BH23CHL5_BH23CHL5_21510 [soil metagenome]
MESTSGFENPGEVACSYHPKVQTLLRCSRCGKPICPQCAVRSPVGLRCPDCAGVRGLPTYATETSYLLKASILGMALAVLIGLVWGFLPAWGFYFSLALGFGVAETMAALVKQKRGRDLMLVGWVLGGTGLIVSRVVLAQRLGYSWDDMNALGPIVERQMHLQLMPDGLFALLPFLIVYVRFR